MSSITLLIPTVTQRIDTLLAPLLFRLSAQAKALGRERDVQVLVLSDDMTMTIGEKRNKLLRAAEGDYCAFFDDDDWPAEEYTRCMLAAADSGKDCAALKGIIYSQDATGTTLIRKVFEHSIRHSKWYEAGGKYFRPPNHINLVRTDIAKRFEFPLKSHGEDSDWSMRVFRAGVLRTEYDADIGIPLYHYAPSGAFNRVRKDHAKPKFDAGYIRSIVT